MNIDFGFDATIVEFYTYRRNHCVHSFIIENVPADIIKEHVESCGFKMDNHISWKNEEGLCFTYSDHTLYIGIKMTGETW